MNASSVKADRHGTGSSRLTRRLVELGEYARREGVTPADVTRCSEIGIIQLRCHRGKTFVVDMPVCSYDNTDLIDAEVAEMIGLTESPRLDDSQQKADNPAETTAVPPGTSSPVKNLAARLVDSVTQVIRPTHNQAEPHLNKPTTAKVAQQPSAPGADSPRVRFEPGSIKQLVQEMLRRAEEIKAQDAKAAPVKPAAPATNASQPANKKESEITEELLATMNRQLDLIEQKSTRK